MFSPATLTATYLGPAVVTAVTPTEIRVALATGDADVPARMALAFPYQPARDDLLLVIGNDESAFFVIGVLQGAGCMKLHVFGDIDIKAVGGNVRISADEAVTIDAKREFEVRTGRIAMVARDVVQKFSTVFSWVKDTLSVRAGKSRRVTDDEDYSQAKKTVVLAEESVKVDAKAIYLGH